MHATIRRYEGVDMTRTNEVASKVKETLVPQLRKLPGFAGYYLIEAGNGIFSSIGLFETPEQGEASSKLASSSRGPSTWPCSMAASTSWHTPKVARFTMSGRAPQAAPCLRRNDSTSAGS